MVLLGFGSGVLFMGNSRVKNKDCEYRHSELEKRLKLENDYLDEWKFTVNKKLDNLEIKIEDKFNKIEKKIDLLTYNNKDNKNKKNIEL